MKPFQLSKPYGAGWLGLLILSLLIMFGNSAFAQRGAGGVVSASGSASSERRVALVIGNGAYDISPLNNPANDARDMAHALTRLGFDVVHRNNLHRPEMLEAIIDFGISLKKGGVGLFYYAGHGVQVGDKNYLMPIGARIPSTSYVPVQAVDLDMVLAGMTDARNRLNIVILDACRNNPYPKTIRASGAGLAAVMAPSGTVVAYSTAPGKVASDGSGSNGLYTSELLRQMAVPGLKIEEMFKRVRAGVYQRSNHKQTPWEHSSLMGDFYFRPGADSGVVPPPPPPPDPKPEPVEAQPSSGVADLHVTTEPGEAVIYLDGQRKGRAPQTFQMLAAGGHKLMARKGYLVAKQDISLARDDLKRVHLKLEHETGSIRVFSTPSGATVYIDGVKHCQTPCQVGKVKAGVRQLSLIKLQGKKYYEFKGPLEVRPGSNRHKFTLERDHQEEQRMAEAERIRKLKEEQARKEAERKRQREQAIREGRMSPDGRYTKDSDGVITDSHSGLQWYVGPDSDTDWDAAKQWVENLRVAGGGWRMPSRGELRSLSQKGARSGRPKYLPPIFKTSGYRVWSGETDGSSTAWLFNFSFGEEGWSLRLSGNFGRAFAVRSRR